MSLMCSSIDTVNLKKKKRWGRSLFVFFHLYYLLLKFTSNPLAKEILANSWVVLAGSILLWLSPCYRAGWQQLPPSHRNGACGHVLHGAKETRHWQEPEVRVQYRSLVLGWGRERQTWQTCLLPGNHSESCQGIHLPRECQADGPVSLRQAELLLLSSTEMSFIRTSQINPTSLCFT